jgi:hypothetical protein
MSEAGKLSKKEAMPMVNRGLVRGEKQRVAQQL